jgi:predicted O-methyltransferase YrrM
MRFRLANAFGLGQYGWFIPYRYRAGSPPPSSPYPEAPFDAARPYIRQTLKQSASYSAHWPLMDGRDPSPAPRFNQDWFPGLDAALLYGLVRALKPARIVEIGSGHSTRFAARAATDEGLATIITAIDPAPRADIAGLSGRVSIQQATIQEAAFSAFRHLVAGDMLFIDSSHVLMPGSDVDILFNRVMPTLPKGVLVHIHDILLPDPYPEAWEWRGYNEQNAVYGLIASGGYQIIASSHYAETRMADDVQALMPDLPQKPEGALATSIWLEKRSPAISEI